MSERVEQLIQEIKEKGIVAPEGLSQEQLEECLAFVDAGSKQSDIDKMYKKKADQLKKTPPAPASAPQAEQVPAETAPAPADPAKPATPVVTMTKEQLDALIQKVTEDATKAVLSNLPKAEPAAAQQQQSVVVHAHQAVQKPDTYDTRNVPEDDYMEEGFRVFHINRMHVFDKFEHGGRRLDPPYSKFILFERYDGPESQRFGSAEGLVTLCVHTTFSKKVKQMFLDDNRWGTDFWEPGNLNMTDEAEFYSIVQRISSNLAASDMSQIKQMANDRKIPVSNLPNMRNAIALHDAKLEHAKVKEERLARQATKSKAALMT